MGNVAHRYALYGLEIRSERALPGLRDSADPSAPADVQVTFGTTLSPYVASSPRRRLSETHLVTVDEVGPEGHTLLAYEDGASTFLVDRHGRWIHVICGVDPVGEDLLRFLLGSVMGWLLRARGVTLVHAATLTFRDRGFALIGASGSGKSTLSTALLQAGCRLMSDDVLALRQTEGACQALPGLARVRLWQDAADQLLGESAGSLPLAHSRPKRLWSFATADERLHPGPCPLTALYLLCPETDAADAPRLERPEGGAVLLSLLANTYPSVEHHPLGPDIRAREFEVLAGLVEQVPLRRIVYRRQLSCVPGVCRVILADLQSRKDGAPWAPAS